MMISLKLQNKKLALIGPTVSRVAKMLGNARKKAVSIAMTKRRPFLDGTLEDDESEFDR